MDVDKYIFISPPDLVTLESRLRGRGTETEERIKKRLEGAVGEEGEEEQAGAQPQRALRCDAMHASVTATTRPRMRVARPSCRRDG